jgi:L-2-hydroxyglutarate oxidase LhgO
MKKNTPEKWVEEFEEKFDDAVVFMNEKVLIFATEDEIKDFIRKTRQEAKQELIGGLIEWAEENKMKFVNNQNLKDIQPMISLEDLIHHLNHLKI